MNRIKIIAKSISILVLFFIFSHCSSDHKTKDTKEKKTVKNIIKCTPEDDLNKLLKPGVTLELFPGKYRKDLVIEQDSITIRAIDPLSDSAEVCFWRSSIRIDHAKNVNIEGIIIRQSPKTSIQINDGSSYVKIKNCKFFACNTDRVIVTLWLDKNTNHCTIENCLFDMQNTIGKQESVPSHVYTIAIMSHQVSCTDHQFIGNSIYNYGYGIQLGTAGTCMEEGRHKVMNNYIDHPLTDGIHVKAAKCIVQNNTVCGARKYTISARAGYGTLFKDNTCKDGYMGIRILGKDHQVTGNKLIRMRRAGMGLSAARENGDGFPAENTVIYNNTFIDCGGADVNPISDKVCSGIIMGNHLPQKIGKNSFFGEGDSIVYVKGDIL